jgi:hypothetical protein
MGSKLFEPTEQNMKLEYPELKDIPEFSTLSDGELRYVWFFSNRQSPYYSMTDKQKKVNQCLSKSYKEMPTTVEIKQFEKGDYPASMQVAMDRMEKFATNDRYRAKTMVDTIFDTFEAIITDNSLMEALDTPQKITAYIDNGKKIREELPELIKMKEEGFGYKKKKGSADGKQPTLMDRAMKEEN